MPEASMAGTLMSKSIRQGPLDVIEVEEARTENDDDDHHRRGKVETGRRRPEHAPADALDDPRDRIEAEEKTLPPDGHRAGGIENGGNEEPYLREKRRDVPYVAEERVEGT